MASLKPVSIPDQLERAAILLAFMKYRRREVVAAKLGIPTRTLYKRLRDYGFGKRDQPAATWADVELLDNLVNELKYVVPPPTAPELTSQ